MTAQALTTIQETVRDALEIKPRFPDEDLYMKWNYGDKPTSKLAQRIINAYRNDKSMTIIIHGDPRIGKSGYAFKTLVQVFDYLFNIRDPILLYQLTMGYEPIEIINMIDQVYNPNHWYKRFRTQKQPAIIWDDGGIWLFNKDYAKSHVKEIEKLFQVLFTKVQVMIITTPTPRNLSAGVRSIPSAVWIEVSREEHDPYNLDIEPPSIRFGRESRIYDPWTSADLKKSGVRKKFMEKFDCRFPDSVYKYYSPIRGGYVGEIIRRIKQETLVNNKRQEKLEQKRQEALNKIIPEVLT